MTDGYRVERDSMGELSVPEEALWGAQTQRAVNNFPISGLVMPRAFIRALGLIKWAAAGANSELGLMPSPTAVAIQAAAMEVAEGVHDAQFPIDVFQCVWQSRFPKPYQNYKFHVWNLRTNEWVARPAINYLYDFEHIKNEKEIPLKKDERKRSQG